MKDIERQLNFDVWLRTATHTHNAAVSADLDVEGTLTAVKRRAVADLRSAPHRTGRVKGRVKPLTAAAVVVYGALGTLLFAVQHKELAIVLLFVVGPGILAFRWHLEAGAFRCLRFGRTPRTVPGWSDEVTRQSGLLDLRAAMLRDLLRRVHRVARKVAAERRVCERHGLVIATSKLDSLGRLLRAARKATKTLATLVAEGSEEAQHFAESCRRDPREACAEYSRLPLTVDPARIGAEVDSLVLVLRLAGDAAVDIPLHMADLPSVRVGTIAAEVETIFREVRMGIRPLQNDCGRMLRAFDMLHCLVIAQALAGLDVGRASRITARAAVAATVLPQPRVRKAAVRTAFLREAVASRGRSWVVWISTATAAAITRGLKRIPSDERPNPGNKPDENINGHVNVGGV